MNLTSNEYKTLVEQSPILIWRSNKDKLCDYFNERWLSFTGKTMDQEYGNGWAEGVHPDDFDHCLKIYVTNFDKRQIFEMRYRLKRHDGKYRWIFDRGVPFYNEKNEFQGYIGSCIDITEQVESEQEIERVRKEKIKQLESLLPVCAWCGKIRKDNNEWVGLELYMRGKQTVTHSICPTCEKTKF